MTSNQKVQIANDDSVAITQCTKGCTAWAGTVLMDPESVNMGWIFTNSHDGIEKIYSGVVETLLRRLNKTEENK